MGKIVDMQKKQDEMNIRGLKKQKLKPKLSKKNISGVKYYAELLGPNANKKYTLSHNQRIQQIKGRTGLTIATIAAILTISGGTAITHSTNDEVPVNTIETQAPLQKDDLLHEANNKLFDYTLGAERDNFDNYYVVYQYDTNDDCTTFSIVTEEKISMQNKSVETVFRYSNTLSFDSFKNEKEISSLINDMIEVYNSDNPSKKQLQDLRNSIDNLEGKNFKLEGNRIVAVKEKNNDFER